MDLFDTFRPIADSVNMGWYFDILKEECETNEYYRIIEKSSKGCMKDILDQKVLKNGEILLIKAKTGIERKAFHAWAESKNYEHCAIKTSHFDPNIAYYCKVCKKTYYEEEMNTYLDWSTTFPGHCYGSIIKCWECDSWYDPDDPEYSDIKCNGECTNAVLVGKTLHTLSKRKTQ